MPRLLGVDVPGRKRIEYALRYIHGIGPKRAKEIVTASKIDPAAKADDLSPDDLRKVMAEIQKYRVEGDLRREVSQNIRRLISIGSYRGLRHRRGLPARGQRTSTNARTRKGPKRTVGAIRDKAARAAIKSK
ncbi:MAG: 30S ribosomal protein S13 [Kiritimatiellia bacterium]|jgi:small subunit ribosomal protein S13|nr:30S ribosomal protein S13 [Kiritimatiellia bacterium]MDP6848887.1 30S ribosomal protein S13 [Kiritimatiellia bacterium]